MATATYADTHALLSAFTNDDATAGKLYNFYWYTRDIGISDDVTDIELFNDGVVNWVRYTHDNTRYEVPLPAVDGNKENPRSVEDHVLFAE